MLCAFRCVNNASSAECEQPLKVMKRAYAVSASIAFVAFFGLCRFMLHVPAAPNAWWHFGLCGVVGA